MEIAIQNEHEFFCELRQPSTLDGALLHSETVTGDVQELIEEAYVRGVLSDSLPSHIDRLEANVAPAWYQEPAVSGIAVELIVRVNGQAMRHTLQFGSGRWVRRSQSIGLRLREEGSLKENETPRRLLLALPRARPTPIKAPVVEPPPIAEQTLEQFGIRGLGRGELVPDRPVLVNQRLVADSIQRCEDNDTTEAGGAVLGKFLRLPEPLPGTTTRIVTVLSATVDDSRHQGQPLSLAFSPEALADAAQIAELRGLGETVQTVYHTHGWSKSCGNCNQNARCPLAECYPSLQDYRLLESLFSSKATLMPIAGRKLGEAGRRPVLQIHAWRGGELRPIRWQEYED